MDYFLNFRTKRMLESEYLPYICTKITNKRYEAFLYEAFVTLGNHNSQFSILLFLLSPVMTGRR